MPNDRQVLSAFLEEMKKDLRLYLKSLPYIEDTRTKPLFENKIETLTKRIESLSRLLEKEV